MESYEVLKRAASEIGVKCLAADMGLSSSLVYKWCQAKEGRYASGAENPLDRVRKICALTGDHRPIAWLCEQINGYYVKNPDLAEEPELPLLRVTQEILKEFSELLDVVSDSIENDGKVDAGEAARIRKEWEDLKSVTESFVTACERGAYRPHG